MPLKKILHQLLADLPVASGAIIVDWEGEAVEQVARAGEFDLKLVGAHGGIVFNRLADALRQTGDTSPREIVLRTADSKILLFGLSTEYVLIVQLDIDALVAPVLEKIRVGAVPLCKEMGID